jgi:hypothetical protein
MRLNVAVVSGTDDSSERRSFRDAPPLEGSILIRSARHEADGGKLADRGNDVNRVVGCWRLSVRLCLIWLSDLRARGENSDSREPGADSH